MWSGAWCSVCGMCCAVRGECGVRRSCDLAWPAGLRALCVVYGLVRGLWCVVWYGAVWCGLVGTASQPAGWRVAKAANGRAGGVGEPRRQKVCVSHRECSASARHACEQCCRHKTLQMLLRKVCVSPRKWSNLARYGYEKCSRHRTFELWPISPH